MLQVPRFDVSTTALYINLGDHMGLGPFDMTRSVTAHEDGHRSRCWTLEASGNPQVLSYFWSAYLEVTHVGQYFRGIDIYYH